MVPGAPLVRRPPFGRASFFGCIRYPSGHGYMEKIVGTPRRENTIVSEGDDAMVDRNDDVHERLCAAHTAFVARVPNAAGLLPAGDRPRRSRSTSTIVGTLRYGDTFVLGDTNDGAGRSPDAG